MFGKQTCKHEKNPKNFEKFQNHVVGSKSNLESNWSLIITWIEKKNYYFYADLKQGRMTYKLSYFMVMWSKSRDQIDRSTDVSLMNRIRKWNITEGIWLTRSSWENSRDMLRKSNFTTISYVLLRTGLRYGFLQWHSTLWYGETGWAVIIWI